jgi:hypothetical protein
LSRATRHTYHPGDQILLQRGCVWRGTLRPRGSGAASARIILAAYGSGALPRLIGDKSSALDLENLSGWTVRDLDLSQIGQTPQALDSGNDHGKDLDSDSDQHMSPVVDIRARGRSGEQDCAASCTSSNITLQDLVVHDGGWNGIYVGAGYTNPDAQVYGRIENLAIDGVESRGNAAAGVDVAGTFTKDVLYSLRNVRVTNSYVHDNGGDGVVLGQVQDGLIQGNHCAYNGRIRNARVGCWTWDSRNVTIQYNESDHNMTPLTGPDASDGGGLDLDMGTVDSTMQYNWTHDNEGEGFLVAGFPIGNGYRCCTTTNATVRYNVSERDGQKLAGGITVSGDVRPAWIYNNTVYYVSSRAADTDVRSGTGGDLTTVRDPTSGSWVINAINNIFITAGTGKSSVVQTNLWSDGQGDLHLDHNVWEVVGGSSRFHLGRSDVTDWSAWQQLGFDRHGDEIDPKVSGPLGAGPTAYQLQPGSPAIGSADVSIGAPARVGPRDYFGTALTPGARLDVGAAEHARAYSTRSSNATPVSIAPTTPSVHLADITPTNAVGSPTATFARGATAYWRVKVVDATGQPVAGVAVTTVSYAPSWDSIYTIATATTDSNGEAAFSHRSAQSDAAGTYFLFPTQVVPGGSAYYDSSGNQRWTTSFTLR